MAGVLITTSVNPFVLGRNAKGDLLVSVRNNDAKEKVLGVEINMGDELSLSKGGLVRRINKHLGVVEPGKTVSFYIDLHTMHHAKTGYSSVTIKVSDYLNENYKHVVRTYAKDVNIRIA